jgi:phosphonate transport system substrate-binding protein
LSEQTDLQVSAVGAQPASAHTVTQLCNGDLDIAWMSIPAYLSASASCGAEAAFSLVRQGSVQQRAQIVVLNEAVRQQNGLSPIRSVADLEGMAVGYTDPRSVTEYILPRAMLAREGATPGSEVFLAGEGQAFMAVYRGEVDAAAGRWWPPQEDGSPTDARRQLLEAYPGILEATRVLSLSEAIPYEAIVFRPDLPADVRAAMVAALASMVHTAEGRRLLSDLWSASRLMPAQDTDYDGAREAFARLQMFPEQLLD